MRRAFILSSFADTKYKTKDKIKEPDLYSVVMHNDDFTTMEFVVEVLMSIFHKDEFTANSLMMNVHKKGSAVVGRYPYDIASTRVDKALAKAKEEGFPFRMTIEK